jgi:hypothetical protein
VNEPLKGVSNVIELKPGYKYLLVFKGPRLTAKSLHGVQEVLSELGIKGVSIALAMEDELQVIEVPEKERER